MTRPFGIPVFLGVLVASSAGCAPASPTAFSTLRPGTPVGTPALGKALFTLPGQVLDGVVPSGLLGNTVSGAGDVDGDGYGDFVAGTSSQRVLLYLGSASGAPTEPNTYLDGSVGSGAGDVNGDGWDDVITGANGVVHLFLGSAGGISENPAATLTGETDTGFGARLVAAGDVDGDGYDDVLVGGGTFDGTRDAVWLFMGTPEGLATTPVVGLTPGATNRSVPVVSAAGDVNGDGRDDVIVGVYSSPSTWTAWLYLGGESGLELPAATTWTGSDHSETWRGLTGVGDTNGDGFDDVAVGPVSEEYTRIYLGSPSGVRDDGFVTVGGLSATAAGDVDGDGFDDMMTLVQPETVALYLGSASGVSRTAAAELANEESGYTYGQSMAAAGDVDGDGLGDVLVGAPGAENDSGRVWLHRGTPAGVDPTAAATWTGASPEWFGGAVSLAGDLNDDGFDDLVVGAHGYGFYTGHVYVFQGSASGFASTPSSVLTGPDSGWYYGENVTGVGDLNADGFDDVVVSGGYYTYEWFNGYCDVYYGSAAGIGGPGEPLPVHGVEYVAPLARVGDVDADGYADVVIGMDGEARLYRGGSGGLTPAPDVLTGCGEEWVIAASGVGDVNGDGHPDALLSTMDDADVGHVCVYMGSADGLATVPTVTWSDGEAYSWFGVRAVGAGDVNRDGWDDVAVSAFGSGQVLLYLGSDAGPGAEADQILTGVGRFGLTIGPAGDVDRDGYADLVVGTPSDESNEGVLAVYRGSPTGLLPDPLILRGETPGDGFGYSVGGKGDANGDGWDDLVTGAMVWNNMQGRVYVWFGATDGDRDGFPASTDCDDTDASIHPGASDTPGDGIDQDCDGVDAGFPDTGGDDSGLAPEGTSSDKEDPGTAPSSCGCATSAGAPWFTFSTLLGSLLVRSRRPKPLPS